MISREAWAEVSLLTIKKNYQLAKKSIQGQEILPVLKANAYGHGMSQVGSLFDGIDIPFLCVASLEEAYQLIEAGIKKDILVFSYIDPSFVVNNDHLQLIFTIPSLEWYQKVRGQGRFHLEINSGMNRMGVKSVEDVQSILASSSDDIEGIYTHFSSLVYDKQSKDHANRFKTMVETLDYDFNYVHAGNISIKLFNEFDVFDSMRMGLGLFGYREDLELNPALVLYANVIYLIDVKPSETVGYDYHSLVEEDGWVASIPIGYADGFDKRQSNLDVWIKDSNYTIIGGICMDQTMILVDDKVSMGDCVELLGSCRSMEKICAAFDTSAYEVLANIGDRVSRKYID